MKRSVRTHDLTVVVPCFYYLQQGLKDFEICFDDKDFLVDDILNLQEHKSGNLTGARIQKRIKYILRKFEGLQSGYLVLGLEDMEGLKNVQS